MFCDRECADAHLPFDAAMRHFVPIDPFDGMGFDIRDWNCVAPMELGLRQN